MKIVINRSFGGFGLSKEAIDYLGYNTRNRTDPKLVECVELLGSRANGEYAELKVVEIPDDVEWYIREYDGMEEVHEKHRIWD